MVCNKATQCFQEILKDKSSVSCSGVTKCIKFCDKRKNAVCDEKGKVYMLENTEDPHKILALHVDGGIVIVDKNTPTGLSKCDYLFIIETDTAPVAILIELKGTDVKHAVTQIESTLNLFAEYFKTCSNVHGRIVFSGGTPNLQNTPDFMRLQRRLKQMSGTLSAKGKILPEKLVSVLA